MRKFLNHSVPFSYLSSFYFVISSHWQKGTNLKRREDIFNIYLSGCEKEGRGSLTKVYYFYMMMKLGQKKLLFMLLLMQTPKQKRCFKLCQSRGRMSLVEALMLEHSLESLKLAKCQIFSSRYVNTLNF